MMKKLLSFMCCLLPLSANAVTTVEPALSDGAAYGGDGNLTSVDVGNDTVLFVNNKDGTGIVISKDTNTGVSGGLTVAQNVFIGKDNSGSTGGELYIGTNTASGVTIQSDGNISVGALLQVLSGRTLGITTKTTGTLVDASFGSIEAVGGLTIQNIDKFSSGAITSGTALSISANTVNAGAIDASGGSVSITASGTPLSGQNASLVMTQFQTASATTTITVNSVESGSIQNNGSDMVMTLTGNLNTLNRGGTNIGSIENVGGSMQVSAGDIKVAGTMKNDSNNGTLTMNVASLKVSGGSDTNRSFINKGNLKLTVAGETDLAYGFDLSGMQNTNTFYLKTGTLKFGNTDAADAWLQVFANKLDSFYLEITGGSVTAGDIINGVVVDGNINTNAGMTVMGQSVNATSIKNNAAGTNAKLIVKATSGTGTLTVPENGASTGNVESVTGSVTDIISAGTLTVEGTVSNSGTMLINGNTVNLAGVTNNGTELKISSLTDYSGVINISSDVNNKSGDLIVNARQIDINGVVTNEGGATTIKGSDANSGARVALGGIDVQGGVFNLDALIGSVSVDKYVSVTKGALNIGASTHNLTAGQAVQVNGDVTLRAGPASGVGNVNIAATGPEVFVLSSTADDANGSITIDGNVSAVDGMFVRGAQFDAKTITVGKDVTAENSGNLIFGKEGRLSQTTISGNAIAQNGGKLGFYSYDTDVGSLTVDNGLLDVRGSQITATAGSINIGSKSSVANLWFDGTNVAPRGMIVTGTDTLTLETTKNADTNIVSDINITGGAMIGTGKSLSLVSAGNAEIDGVVTNGGALTVNAAGDATFGNSVTTNGSLTVYAQNITTQDITNTNTGTMTLGNADNVASVAAATNITTGTIKNSGTTKIKAGAVKTGTGAIETTGGTFAVTADSLNTTLFTVSGGTATLDVENTIATKDIKVSGDLVQGSTNSTTLVPGTLNIVHSNASVTADALTVGGMFKVLNGSLALNVLGEGGVAVTGAIENSGNLTLNVLNGFVTADSFVVNTGTTALQGKGMTLTGGAFGAADKSSMLYQVGPTGTASDGDFRILNSVYALSASKVALKGIEQAKTNQLTINTSDLQIAQDIDVVDMRVAAKSPANWLDVDVGGNVSGGAQFIGLKSMNIGGNYKFNNNSQINAAILEYSPTTTSNYWATVSLNDDSTLGKITNAADGKALIQVGGAFESSASLFNVAGYNKPLAQPQVGLVLNSIVDPGTAIWLLYAKDGVSDADIESKIRNLNVSFCNADGSVCFDYLGAFQDFNGTNPKDDLPAYISVRDSTGDGAADSLYVVFDPRFGGPVEVFKIQPIVGRTDDYTAGEYSSAGAIDDMIAGQLISSGFYNRTPIEAIPVIFKNTNMATVANELYDRMEYYNLSRDGTGLARFSRLFQPRETEQLVGAISLNEHTNFRSFEDRMFDEFIWNRNRNLKKAWLDVDYGMFYQNATDGKHIDGNRFNIAGGFDWQESQTLLLGLTGRVSRMSSDNFDDIDLEYLPGQHIAGHVKTTVSDTDIGLGAYLMKILGQKTRVYGNGFLDIHLLDVEREQDFVSKISGSGTAFSLMSEWGLLHDWLNQYVVGNMYARVGYNFGFDVSEEAAGQDYMTLKSDGYFTFTPGYSLTAQKRIYPSAWIQVRPYATVGVEYDVLGAPDSVKYKFAAAGNFTSYDVDIDPLWANIGGGVEVLSATGIQVGIDYRYQYNADIQLHNIRLSGSYRF